MKFVYIANVRLPTEKAHGIQIMQMCETFSRQGAEVELVVPWRFNPIKKDSFEYYNVEKNFKITKVPSVDLVKLGKIGFWIQSFSFAKLAVIYTLLKNPDIIYSREILPFFFLSFFKKDLFWESHRGESNFIVKRLFKKCRGIIAITRGLKDFCVKKGVDGDKILVAPDGVDLEKFDIKILKEEARPKVGLPQDKKVVLYTGHFYGWKGADILAEASKFFNEDVLFVFVGGTAWEISEFKKQNAGSKNLLIVGLRPHQEIPYWLKAADVLVLPNSAKEKISQFYTSPLKLFEYMASGTPIVASDLPSIREVLNEENAVLVEPNNPRNLADGIKEILKDPGLADRILEKAREDVENYTWDKRAENILEFIKKKI